MGLRFCLIWKHFQIQMYMGAVKVVFFRDFFRPPISACVDPFRASPSCGYLYQEGHIERSDNPILLLMWVRDTGGARVKIFISVSAVCVDLFSIQCTGTHTALGRQYFPIWNHFLIQKWLARMKHQGYDQGQLGLAFPSRVWSLFRYSPRAPILYQAYNSSPPGAVS